MTTPTATLTREQITSLVSAMANTLVSLPDREATVERFVDAWAADVSASYYQGRRDGLTAGEALATPGVLPVTSPERYLTTLTTDTAPTGSNLDLFSDHIGPNAPAI